MKAFKIPVTWEVYGTVEVYADNVVDALERAYQIEAAEGLPLPAESEYIDGSFEITDDLDFIKMINQ